GGVGGRVRGGPRPPRVPLPADADGPVDRRAAADRLLPLRADLREVVREDEGRAAAVGAVHRYDRSGRQLHPRILLGDWRIVPHYDLAEENPRQRLWRELELLDAWDVVRRHYGTQHGGEVQDRRLCLAELLVCHGSVGGTEVDRALEHLTNASTAADRLIVDLYAGLLPELVEPLGVDGV